MPNDQHNSRPRTHRFAARFADRFGAAHQAYRTLNTVTRRAFGMLFKLVVLAYFLFCAVFLGLRYLVLPQIDNYKPDVERIASRALGNQVSIATIHASWDGLQPHLALGNVTVHDKSGNEALRLPKVETTVSWWSVMAGELMLHSLEISRPDMDITRDAEGNIYVAGIFIDTQKTGNGKGLDWVLSQREIVIRDGRVQWTDKKRGAAPLVLDNVDFVLNNHWRAHRFAFKATPPAAFAAPIDVRAAFEHPHFTRSISDPSLWKGELYAALADTDLSAWNAYFDYPAEVKVEQGKGSVRAWLNFNRSRVADLTADLTLTSVAARLRNDLEPLKLARVNGRISLQEDFNPRTDEGKRTFGTRGHAIALTDFSLRTEDGLELPTTTISERYLPAAEGQPEITEIAARLVDLRTIADFAARLPLPAAHHQALADFAPRGMLQDFSLQWRGAYPNVSTYAVKGRFASLSLNAQPARPARHKTDDMPAQAAVPAIPGFENLTGNVDANERGGTFILASEALTLNLPGYLADPEMSFDTLNMQAKWAFQANDQLQFEVQQMDFVQAGLSGSLSGKHLMPLNRGHDKLQGMIDMTGKLNGLDLQSIGKYLPMKTPDGLRSWLAGALVGGTADDIRIRVKGDLAHFPFHTQRPGEKPKGEFSVIGRIENGVLNYAPGKLANDGKSPLWPVIDNINGSIAFDRTRMEIKADSARTSGVALTDTKAVIADLTKHHDMLLAVDGGAAGPLQDFLRFTNESPVAELIGHFTEETKASGNARLALKLKLPLGQLTESKVQGSLLFINNNVTLQNIMPPILSANGKLDFHEKGFSLNGIKGNFLGGPIAVLGGTQRDGEILVKADGSLSVEGIRKTYQSAAMQGVLKRLNGGTRYSTTIRIKNKRPEIVVESGLQGLGLDFPAPLRKAANENLPLKFELNALPSTDVLTLRDEIRLTAGSAISARYERQKAVDKGAEWRVLRGGIGVNVPAPLPDSGVIASVSVDKLNIDAWRDAVGAPESEPAPAQVQPQVQPQGEVGLGLAQYIEPEVLAARATELTVMGKKLDSVVVGASHQNGVWQANIDSQQASGYVTWNESRSGRGMGRVTARLASLVIPKSAASDVTELLEGKNATTQMPGLDIIAENFELFGKKFGHLELAANNVRGTAGREWRINKLSISNPDGQLSATGSWNRTETESISSLNYTLAISDAGKLLDRFGFANVIRGGKGKMEGQVSWNGLPFSLDIPSLSGRVQLDMAAGQFLKVDPAAAKLLGVLSLQSLPRRLALDFRDVFSEGFAFDGVTALANIKNGVAKTDNFKMRGVAATVLIDGTADIAKESQNLHVVVIPEINVGAASVVYGLAVNPVIGVGTFLAQLFLREPLMKAFTFEYEITGPWKDPVVTKLVRKPAAPPVSGETGRHSAYIG